MLPAGNQKVLAEQHNDEHYLFHLDCGSGLISHHFWQLLLPCGSACAAEPNTIIK